MIQHFEKVQILSESWDSPVALRFREIFPASVLERIENESPSDKGSMTAKEFSSSKKRLLLKRFKGQFFKRCPGATQKRTLTCCNYYVLNLGSQCHMNCSYCYLQSYLNQKASVVYTNIEDALLELDVMAQQHSDLPYRVGTGEVIDSLGLDPLTLYSHQLIPFFRKYPKWTLEFKTKTNHVDQFLHLPHVGNVVTSWSINAANVIESEEHGTASLDERLLAARKCADHGFPIAFHLDPLILHSDWKANYQDLVTKICDRFRPEEIHVLSIGTLRFQPEQRSMMRERFGMKSYVTTAEMFPSEGGKLRYSAEIRSEMYQFVLNEFKKRSPKYKAFMCMETPESWLSSYKSYPSQAPELRSFFRPLPKIRPLEGEQYERS